MNARRRELPFGEWLRGLREARGLTLRALAEATGEYFQNLWQIEQGKRAPTETWLRAAAGPLETDPDELCRRAGILPSDVRDWALENLASLRGLMK